MAGKQFTDLTKASALKDSDIIAVHDGNGLKQSNMADVTTYMSDKFSNPNLLINPDFKINQRGKTTYLGDSTMYSVDRWRINNTQLIVNSDNTITLKNNSNTDGYFQQPLEEGVTGNYTTSYEAVSVSGTCSIAGKNAKVGINTITQETKNDKLFGLVIGPNSSITLKWFKLEQGSIATPFVAPNPAEELDKCFRYFQTYEGLPFIPELLNVSDVTSNATTWTSIYSVFIQQMRVKPTVTYNFIANRSGAKIDGNHSITFDNKRLITLRLAQSSNFHTIFANKLTLDAEIY